MQNIYNPHCLTLSNNILIVIIVDRGLYHFGSALLYIHTTTLEYSHNNIYYIHNNTNTRIPGILIHLEYYFLFISTVTTAIE